jgi:hypothetical protein
MPLWIFVGWGAYRELNDLSKIRSFLALTLFSLFFIPVFALLSSVGFQLLGAFAQGTSG